MHKKLKTIGLMIPVLHGKYATPLWKGIEKALEDEDVNILIFPGRTPNWGSFHEFQSSVIYDKIHTSAIDALLITSSAFSNFMTHKQLSSFFEPLKNIPTVFIGEPFNNMPSVQIDNIKGFNDLLIHVFKVHNCKKPAVITGPMENLDSKIRFETLQKQCNNFSIPLLSENIFESDYSTDGGALGAKSLFSKKKKTNTPDLLVCLNDNMAFGAISELKRIGFRVPHDVKVIGYDNSLEADFFSPALSTVTQSFTEQSFQATKLAIQLIEGKSIPKETWLSTEMVIRNSCGCYSSNDTAFKKNIALYSKMHKNIEENIDIISSTFIKTLSSIPQTKEIEKSIYKNIPLIIEALYTTRNTEEIISIFGQNIYSLIELGESIKPWISIISLLSIFLSNHTKIFSNHFFITSFLESCHQILYNQLKVEQGKDYLSLQEQSNNIRSYLGNLQSAISSDHIFNTTLKYLVNQGIRSLFIFCYDKPLEHVKNTKLTEPQYSRLVFGIKEGKDLPRALNNKLFLTKKPIPEKCINEYNKFQLIFHSLYYMNEIIGYIVIDMSDMTREIYDIIVSYISSALKTASLYAEREKAEQQLKDVLENLEKSNHQLLQISENDELTGLYNRRGFLNLAKKSINLARQMGKGGLVFYADLDGLKKINDMYGHLEGDIAIKATGNILKKTFRNMDIISRLGGDEFTILVLNTDAKFVPIVRSRLHGLINNFNTSQNNPWKLSCSLGYSEFFPGSNVSLEELMDKADNSLYEEKKLKKGH